MLDIDNQHPNLAARGLMNMDSEFDDNGSMNHPEGGAQDNQDFGSQFDMQTKQYIPRNMRKDFNLREAAAPFDSNQPGQTQ